MVPMPPGEAPIIPVGLRAKEFEPHGRDPRSMALQDAGNRGVYSGDTTRMPSEALIASLRARPSGGKIGVVVVAVQGKVLDGDLGKLKLRRSPP